MPKEELTRYCLLLSLIVIGTLEGAGNNNNTYACHNVDTPLVITVGPISVTTTLYTSINFTCEGNGEYLNWLIQNAELTDLLKQQRNVTITNLGGPGNLSSVLTITALPINDEILITCHIYSFKPSFNQDFSSGTLTIRGK